MIEVVLIFALVVVIELWTSSVAVCKCQNTNRKGEFHHYVTSGQYNRDRSKEQRNLIKAQGRRNKSRNHRY